MLERYLISFAIAGTIFALIVIYSMIKQRRDLEGVDDKKESYVDPLFEELEERKSAAKAQQSQVAETASSQENYEKANADESITQQSEVASSSVSSVGQQSSLPLEPKKPQVAESKVQQQQAVKTSIEKTEPSIAATQKEVKQAVAPKQAARGGGTKDAPCLGHHLV